MHAHATNRSHIFHIWQELLGGRSNVLEHALHVFQAAAIAVELLAERLTFRIENAPRVGVDDVRYQELSAVQAELDFEIDHAALLLVPGLFENGKHEACQCAHRLEQSPLVGATEYLVRRQPQKRQAKDLAGMVQANHVVTGNVLHERIVARQLPLMPPTIVGLEEEFHDGRHKRIPPYEFRVSGEVRTPGAAARHHFVGKHVAERRRKGLLIDLLGECHRYAVGLKQAKDVAGGLGRQRSLTGDDVMLGSVTSGDVILGEDPDGAVAPPDVEDTLGFSFCQQRGFGWNCSECATHDGMGLWVRTKQTIVHVHDRFSAYYGYLCICKAMDCVRFATMERI